MKKKTTEDHVNETKENNKKLVQVVTSKADDTGL